MQLSKVDITGELRVTHNDGVEVWDRQIALFPSNKSKILQGFYDMYWFDLVNGTKFGDADTADVSTGYTFELSTDASPTLDSTAFSAVVPLTVAPATVDRFEQNAATVYEVGMSASYADVDTAVITAVGIHFISYDDIGASVLADNFIAKSTAPLGNVIYDAGLVLRNQSIITVKYRVKVAK